MAAHFHESNVDFAFHADWAAMQFDASSWYRDHFQACGASAAVDFLALSPDRSEAWLVEVKDFTTASPSKEKGPLSEIIVRKVRDTLAGVLAGRVNAGVEDERDFFRRFAKASTLRVVFHCERPKHKSKLFKALPDAADLQQKLRKDLRAVDTKPRVVDCASTATFGLPWAATWAP